MLKTSTLMILGTLAFVGCASPQSTARDADEAQHEANEKTAYANEDVKIKADATQKRANEENAENAREGAQKSAEAQGDANKKSAEAGASLAKARIEARNDNETKLAGLDKQFAELKPKLVKKLSTSESTNVVNDLTAKSEAVRRSIADLAFATADSLEPVKSTIAQRLSSFDQAISDAKKRV